MQRIVDSYVNDQSKKKNYPERRRDYRKPVSVATINNYIRNQRVFFNWLEKDYIIRKNPMRKIRQLKYNRQAKVFLSDDDLKKLLSKMDNSYAFLPSYATMEDVRVVLSSGHQISLGGINLSNGMTCEVFMLETGYPLEINDSQKTTLWFYQLANVATMYVDTVAGNMGRIHKDKNYEENISLTLYSIVLLFPLR